MGIEVIAQTRKLQGTGASRRLRHSGKVPGILYGGKTPPVSIELEHNALYHQVRMEKFHASILDLVLDGKKEQVLLRNVNMHPWRVEVQHIDFQRVLADRRSTCRVPLHFVNAEISPASRFRRRHQPRHERDRYALPARRSARVHRGGPEGSRGRPLDPRRAT